MNKKEDLDRIKRIEEIMVFVSKLARTIKRRHNQLRRTINGNVEIFDDRTIRNETNIDKITNTLKELMGEEVDKKHVEQLINSDSERIYL